MSQYPHGPPPPGPPPPPYYGPPHWPPPPGHPYPPPPHDGGQVTAPPTYPYYVPTMMFPIAPVPLGPMPVQPDPQPSNPTYITNYIYHGESSQGAPAIEDKPQMAEMSGDYDWVASTATTASQLAGRAVVGGHEGWDGSPLWVIRAWHMGDLIPGKFSVRHNAASITYDRKEIGVQNIEVLVSRPESLQWIPATNGTVPNGAIPGGRTASGENVYVGRARYQLSITPGKVHPSHNCCYIGFAGNEVSHKMYDVLCRV
ncbi:WW domain-binding protein 11-like [Pectinophora gossypiella]|uniref:WW domain-binding protein 11-like n=1 Tax=Pectinophora gossypiella TaxID=13191 RepID=UPI00214E2723|nr:WW domain-binding protein 11-like [Pectinophora gossypiella]